MAHRTATRHGRLTERLLLARGRYCSLGQVRLGHAGGITAYDQCPVLPAKTRLKMSLVITAFALGGVFVSDQLEKAFPAPAAHTISEDTKTS